MKNAEPEECWGTKYSEHRETDRIILRWYMRKYDNWNKPARSKLGAVITWDSLYSQ
jgi:fibrillarin-like rRNA methylase